MKKAFLIMINALLLVSVSGNCQWYQRRYGVNNINQLSQQQLTEAFLRSRGGARAGALLSAAGAIGIGVGLIMFRHDSPYPGDIERNVFGVLVTGVSIPIEITGLTIWGISGTRLQTIKAIMKNTDIKFGVLNYSPCNKAGGSNCSSIPCVSLTYNF